MPAMSTSISNEESYLDQNFSIYQLLRVAKSKLQGTAFVGWSVHYSRVDKELNTEVRYCRVVPTLGEAEVGPQGRMIPYEFIMVNGVVFLGRHS